MEKRKTARAAACALAFLAFAAAADSYYIVTMTDFVGNKSFEVADRQKCAELKAAVAKQNAYLARILRDIEKDFRQNPDAHAGEKFYGGKLKRKTFKMKGPIADYYKAQAQVEKLQGKADNKDIEKSFGKKSLSDAEKEKLFLEAQKQAAVTAFAQDVERKIDEAVKAEK